MPLLFVAVCLVAVTMVGCTSSSTYDSYPAVSTGESAVHEDVQTRANQRIGEFVSEVQKRNFAEARKLMSPSLQTKTPVTLAAWAQQGGYNSLLGASDWKFDQHRFQSRGKKMVVHAQFTGADGGHYRTNFELVDPEKNWQINLIIPPSVPTAPKSSNSGKMSSMPGH